MNQQNDNRKVDQQLPIKTFLDCEYSKQPENAARFVLNMVDDSIEGSLGSLVNEPSNLQCFEFPDSYIACGFISINKRYHLGFYSLNYESDVIVKLDTQNCEYEILVEAVFGFNPAYKITGYTETREGCDTIVYWRDSLNADRFFNLNRTQDFKDNAGNWIINNFRINPLITNPICNFTVQESGGSLELGTYYFVLEFFDRSKNLIYKSLPEGGINIYPSFISVGADGGHNIDSFTEENGGKPKTSKSITINISNIGMYAYAKLNVIKFTSGDGVTRTAHTTTEYHAISQSGELTIYYRGFNAYAGDYELTADELLQRQVIYHDSKVIRSIQGRQVKFNINSARRDYSTYQKSASKIKTTFEVDSIKYSKIVDGQPLKPTTPVNTLSERGGEVKSYGIVYVHSDFTISPEFHIPGRAKTEDDAERGFTRIPSICPEYNVNDYDDITTNLTIQVVNTFVGGSGDDEVTDIIVNTPGLEAWHIRCEEIPEISGFDYSAAGAFLFTHTYNRDPYEETRPRYRTYIVSIVVDGVTYETRYALDIDKPFDPFDTDFSEYVVESVVFKATGNGNINKLEKWKYQDTSDDTTKLLGYHQTCQSIYEDYDCVEDYWGEDWQGNSLSGTPVRHHVIPDRTTIPLLTLNGGTEDNKFINVIGVKFDNIEYPSDDIIGHFFVSGFGEERVIANAVSTMFQKNDDRGYYINYARYGNPDTIEHEIETSCYQNLIVPENLFEDGYSTPITMRVNKLFNTNLPDVDDINIASYFQSPYSWLRLYEKRHDILSFIDDYDDLNDEYRIIDNRYISRRSFLNKGVHKLSNNSYINEFNLITLDANVPKIFEGLTEDDVLDSANANLRYVSLIRYQDTYSNLENIRYRRINPNILTLSDSQIVYGGDVYISKLDYLNVPWIELVSNEEAGEYKIEAETINNLFIESPINMELRHSGSTECTQYYDSSMPVVSVLGPMMGEDDGDEFGSLLVRAEICENYFGYNRDYSLQNLTPLFVFRSLSKFYNFCSDCIDRYPTQIIWTDPQSEGDQVLREFKPLNYKVLEGHRGEIIDVANINEMLLIRTTQSLFFLRSDNQQLQLSGGSVIQLGTGEFFKLFETEIITSDLGKYGQQGILHSLNSHLGPIWINQEEGEIYWYSGEIKTISKEGFAHFFDNNLPSQSIKVFPYLDLSDISMAYDDKFKRIMLHKSDFVPTQKFINDLKGNKIYYDASIKHFRIAPASWNVELEDGELLGKYPVNDNEKVIFEDHVVKGGNKVGILDPNAPTPDGPIIDFSDKEYFINRSFTMSYSLNTQSWRFHSYQPDQMFYNNDTFFTALKNTIFKQNYGEGYSNFYGTDFPCIFEYVVKDYFAFHPDGIHFYTKAILDNAENKNVTFDKIWIYTNNHSTGIRDLLIPTSEFDNILYPNNLYLIESERDYKIGDVIDYSTTRPITSEEWKDIFSYYYALSQGYIDKVPVNVDFDQEMVTLGQFRDKYIVVRLFFNNHDYRLSLDAIQTIKHYG